jgi:hypothetical protein
MSAILVNAVPVGLITRSGPRVTGVLVTDDPDQFDACDCHGFAWAARDLTYEPGPDAFVCPLNFVEGGGS